MPAVEQVRFVATGTEAAMAAVRLARAATGRSQVIKFAGCYHGHADAFLIRAGSGAATLGVPDSPGVTPGAAADTRIARYNDLDDVDRCFRDGAGAIAAVIVEPVAGNMGCVPPEPGFLAGLRERCDRAGALSDPGRGDHRVPSRPGRGVGALRHHARTWCCSARCSAAACRSPPTAGGVL